MTTYRFFSPADGSELIPALRLDREPRADDYIVWSKGEVRVLSGPAKYERKDFPVVHWQISLPAEEVKPERK